MKTLSGPPTVFQRILEVFHCKPETNFSASCINYQTKQYASWHPGRNTIVIDAFSISWSELNFYEFPLSNSKGLRVAVFGDHDYIMVENIVLISHDCIITEEFPDTSPSEYTEFTIQNINTTFAISQNETISYSLIRQTFRNTTHPRAITYIIVENNYMKSIRILGQWFVYSKSPNTDSYTPDENNLLSFMHGMYKNVLLYSGPCAARSSFSSITTIKHYTKLSGTLLSFISYLR